MLQNRPDVGGRGESSRDSTVLIAGAGPTGLVLACELARRGIPCRLIDRAPHRSPDSRATDIHARTLEVFRDLGVADEIIARGKKVRAFNAFAGGRRISQLDLSGIETTYPFTIAIPQSETEAILEARLNELGVEIERNVELADLHVNGGVDAVLRSAKSGAIERVRAPFLAGCDGIGSFVRDHLHIPFEGISYPERYYVADVSIDWALPDDEVHLFMSAAGFFNVVALPGMKRGRILCDYPENPRREPTLELFSRALAERTGIKKVTLRDPTFMASFRIQRRLVPRYRHGPVFLAGDAAHTCSPLLGQGMNVGIQDAHNLGWKLALVARGEARPELLDSYGLERRPVARRVLVYTHLMHSVSKLGGRMIPRLRNAACMFLSSVPPLRSEAAMICAALGVCYTSSAIVSEATAPAQRLRLALAPRPGLRAPDVKYDGASTLHDLLSGAGHVLFLFAGERAEPVAIDRLARIASEVEARFGEVLAPHLVSPGPRTVPERARPFALSDPSGVLHRRYGAKSDAVYLVRPDGHIAFRSQPADRDALFAHLSRVFVERARSC